MRGRGNRLCVWRRRLGKGVSGGKKGDSGKLLVKKIKTLQKGEATNMERGRWTA